MIIYSNYKTGTRLSFFLLVLFMGMGFKVHTQNITSLGTLKDKLALFEPMLEGGKFKDVDNMILNDPGVYNDVWGKVYNGLRNKENQPVFKNLKMEFKTFQGSDNEKTSLGFSYHWDYDINNKKETAYERSGFDAKIKTAGNIAFIKNLNPLDFQEAKLELGRFGFFGGTVNQADSILTRKMNGIRQKLALIEDEDELASSPLWNDLTQAMGIKNHYHYNVFAVAGWEGSQDFSKSQLSYGAQLRFSAKSYSDKNALAQLNILDYPFALIRYITGTDKAITPYGATLPIITTGIEIVKPTHDTSRQKLTGNQNQFARFRFEAGFRTLIADIAHVPLHFNAAFRYFTEINAPQNIGAAGLGSYTYFTCSVTGANTYFVSYSYGNLPFDRTANAVYAIGFKFNL